MGETISKAAGATSVAGTTAAATKAKAGSRVATDTMAAADAQAVAAAAAVVDTTCAEGMTAAEGAASVSRAKAPRGNRVGKRWTRAKQRLFLDELARTSNVSASERKAKMPAGSAYRERHRSPAFDLEWLAALREGYAQLEMLERARAGVVKRTIKLENGSELLEYSDRGGMALLAAHRATVTAAASTTAPALDIKARLAAKLAEMDRRKRGEE